MSESWSVGEIEKLKTLYEKLPHDEIGELIGKSEAAVRNKCYRLKLRKKEKEWTDEECAKVKAAYSSGGYVDTVAFAESLGRSVTAVNLKVSRLGYGNASRPLVAKRKVREPMFSSAEERAEFTSKRFKAWIKENGHPRGALGMKHSEQTKAAISLANTRNAANRTDEQKAAMVMKQMKTRVKNGTDVFQRNNASWKSGWREIGGVKKYYRSKWEANYAHYLQWLLENKQIKEWLHEPVTFWFEGVKRGCVSYLPDFWILENDGSESYHEVKGWMDDRSKTKIRRMAKYHPTVKLVVIDSSGYNALKKSVKGLVPGWED
jgi:hypothetical protein